MTKAEAARRYLQADMARSYTGLPKRAQRIHVDTMRRLEDKFPDVAEHAIVGTSRDFDEALSSGEREHQKHLRRGSGWSEQELAERRARIRRPSREKPTRPPRPRAKGTTRRAVRAGYAGARAYRSAARQTGIPGALESTSGISLQLLGLFVGLGLAYLVLSQNGSKALSTLLAGVVKVVQLFISPIDPLNPSGKSTSSSSTSSTAGENTTPAYHSATQTRNENPSFGPAPGIGNPLQPAGAYP